MKKFLLFLVAVMTMVSTATAQEAKFEKKRVLIDYFSRPNNPHTVKYVNQIRNQVISGISATKRLVVIDVDSESTLKIEESRRSSEAAMGDDVARTGEMKKLGANFALFGSLDGVVIEKKKTDDGKIFYTAKITVSLKAVNLGDGSTHVSETLAMVGGGSLLGAGSTPEKAISGAIGAIKGKMETFIDLHFPLLGKIVEVKDQKKGKLQSAYIDLGSLHGVSKGQYVVVSAVKTIAGRKSQVELGRMKVDEVVAEDLSLCKVTKNGEEMLKAFSDGQELVVKTIKDAGIGGLLKTVTY